MESIGPKTLSLMTEAIYNYVNNIATKPDLNLAARKQVNDCLIKLSKLTEIANTNQLKKAA